MFAASKTGAPVNAKDPQFNYVTMLLHGDGTNGAQNNTFLDSSTNNFTITRNGNTTQGTFTPYGSNWSNYITTGYLDTPTINLGTSFTIEFFVNFPTAPTSNNIVLGNPASGGGTFWIGITATNLSFSYGGLTRTFSFTAVAGTWYYFQIINSALSVSAYVNGSQIGTTQTGSASFSIDRIAGYPTVGFSGYLSNLRVTNAANSVSATPTTPLTAITNCVLLTCQSNRFVDNSTNAYTLTPSSGISVQRFSPFSPTTAYSTSVIGGSGYFDGSGDYLTASQNAAFNFGTGAFTVEALVYITASNGTNQRIIGLGDGAIGGGPYTGWSFNINNNLTTINWYRYDGTETDLNASYTFKTNTWYHIVAVRNGSSNLSMFVNGSRVYNNASASLSYSNVNTNPLYVGLTYDGAGGGGNKFFNGYMSSARIVAGSAVYDPTASTLTVPTAPLTAITNTSLLLSYTNAGILDNAMMNDLETVGNAQISTSVKKYGTGSMYFDGTGDYLYEPSTPNLTLGSGDFTVEMWVNPTSLSGTLTFLLAMRPATTNGAYPVLYADNTGTYWYVSSANRISGSTLSTGAWTHLAIARSGTSTKMFINGTQTGSTYTDSTNYLMSRLYIGASDYNSGSSEYLTGYIDDLRITKGVARYTANFTAPTAAFPNN